MHRIHRRDVLKSTVSASLAYSALPLFSAQKPGKYKTALIGTGWWGMNILSPLNIE